MLLSANLIKVHNAFGMRGTLDVFSEVGIQGIDFNADIKEYYTSEHNEAFYSELGKYANENQNR